MPQDLAKTLHDHIAFIYGEGQATQISARISERIERFRASYPDLAASSPENRVSETPF